MAGEDGVETQAELAEAFESEGILGLLMGDSAPGEPAPTEQDVDTGSAVEQPRDDKGRFASTKVEDDQVPPAETPDQPEGTPPENVVEENAAEADDDEFVIEIDDDLQSVLDRYDGDIGKALRALNDSQSMIGRQANEVGQLRQQLAELQQTVQQGFQQQQVAPAYLGPYRNDLEENPQGLVMEALERGDIQTMEMAIRAWGEEEPFEAATFLFSLAAEHSQQAVPQAPAPVAPQGVGETLEQAMADVVNRHPDVEKYLPAIGETAREFPTLRSNLESGTPAQKAQAFEELLVITKTRSQSTDTSKAVKRVLLKTQEEVRKEKSDAAVVSAQTQSAATAQKQGLDLFYDMFDEAAERYSPADWITRSND